MRNLKSSNEVGNLFQVGPDLVDGIYTAYPASDGFWGHTDACTVNHNNSGLTNGQLFSSLTNNVSIPGQFNFSLNNSGLITGSNTVQSVTDLFNSY